MRGGNEVQMSISLPSLSSCYFTRSSVLEISLESKVNGAWGLCATLDNPPHSGPNDFG